MAEQKDYFFIEQLKAINCRLVEPNIFFERKIRRWYSQNFNTPLDKTYDLNWEFILSNYYESMIEEKSFNEVYDIAIGNYLPELAEDLDKEAQAFADSLVELQEKQLAAKAPKKPFTKPQEDAKIEVPVPKFEPVKMSFGDELEEDL